jgi:plastocyanin
VFSIRGAADVPIHHGAHAAMTDAAMKIESERWYATHPRVGVSSVLAPPAATFLVTNFRFDADGSANTQQDTVQIQPGQTVQWQWDVGAHTVTDEGLLFDQPIDSGNHRFAFTYDTEGAYPFFCRFHGDLYQMRGVVIVGNTVGVPPGPGEGGSLGFTVGPLPNPARTGVTFRFAQRQPGPGRAEVFDSRGRRVAVVVNRDLPAGLFLGAWDGRATNGSLAASGIYYLRLRLPGYAATRAIVLTR